MRLAAVGILALIVLTSCNNETSTKPSTPTTRPTSGQTGGTGHLGHLDK